MMPFNEQNKESFKILQFIGFIFLIAGNAFYNNLINIKYSKDSEKNVKEIISHLSEQKILDLDKSIFVINSNEEGFIDKANELNNFNIDNKSDESNSNINQTKETEKKITENSEENKSENKSEIK